MFRRYLRQRRFDREWNRHVLRAAATLGRIQRIGNDYYLVTITGQSYAHIKGHVWAKLEIL